ncbi:MAG TPA: hypothetical protein DCE41_34085 [Cytophagales bacterium]|nr:hypothetical protein [Cytophagales bacterium]HAA21573.1 hypothetical protein [Cytophagales bacterium]HAP59032.1 hypothetical protein [Cytophagales bacterium]
MGPTYDYTITAIAAALFASALIAVILYFSLHRRVAYLFFALYCVSHAAKVLMKFPWLTEEFPGLNPSAVPVIIYGIVILGMLSMLGFILFEYEIKGQWRWWTAAASLCLLSLVGFQEGWYINAMFALCAGVLILPIRRGQRGAVLTLVGLGGLALCTYLGYRDFLNFGYFLGIFFFIFCLLLAVSQQIHSQISQKQEAEIRSTQLENQLLKQTIQPHFLLNSLTNLQELIYSDVEAAGHFVQSLAQELELFCRVSAQPTIPLATELALVEAHMRIMEVRKGQAFSLETLGFRGEEYIPPGILHTLVENGIKHGYKDRGGRFVLSRRSEEQQVIYRLRNDGETNGSDVRVGTGLRYVEARLEESYPQRWAFDYGPTATGWENRITIQKNGKEERL